MKLFAGYLLFFACLPMTAYSMCPSGCKCMADIVRCLQADLSSIPAAGVSSTVRILDIRHNSNLTYLGRDAFRAFRGLHILLLSNNAITTIHPEAFKSLRHVQYIYLHGNKITTIPPNLFKGLNTLRLVSLFNNNLRYIGEDAFDGNMNLKMLYAQSNELTTLNQSLFHTTVDLEILRLDSNPLVCNCSLLWLLTFQPASKSIIRCHLPSNLKGRIFFSLTSVDLGCGSPVVKPAQQTMSGSLGDELMLNCPHTGSPTPTVQWIHNNGIVEGTDKYTQLANGSLVISSMNAENAGLYVCVVSNVFGRAQMNISVEYSGQQVPAKIINYPPVVMVARGFIATLSCKTRAHPTAVIIWTKNGSPLPKNGRFIADPKSYKLRIFEVEASDAGVYTCMVRNTLGSDQKNITVVVKAAPVIVGGPSEVIVVRGRPIYLQCNNSGDPKPTIIWIKNDLELEVGERVFINPFLGQLEILNARDSDSGEYMCRAINDLGATSYSVKVVVRAPRLPIFSKEPQDTSTPLGGNFSLECRAHAATSVTWLFNSKLVVTSSRVRIVGIALIVTEVQESDEGEYTCVAKNSDGEVRSSAQVNVVGDILSCNGIISPGQFISIRNDVNNAFTSLIRSANSSQQQSPSKLLMLLRLPDEGTIELSKAAEIFSEAISRVEANTSLPVDSIHPNSPIKLSECELHFLATLSGCKASKSNVSCNDYCRHSKYRTYDGTCNNLQHSYYGASVMPFSRLLEADYENDINLPKGWSQAMHNPFSGPKPSARLISSSVLASSEVTPDRRYTLMLMQFGQFLDHDLDIAPTVPSDEIFRNGSKCSELCGTEPPCFPIMVPPNDTRIKTRRCISFTRSSAMCGSGSSSALVGRAAYRREQINDITSFTDASMVYGSNKRHADELRDSSYGLGKLKLGAESSPGKYLLPYDNKSLVDCQQPDNTGRLHTPCFLAGDIRVNEQVGLSSMHTIFAREHNRIAKSLSALNTHWGDEKLYQEARKIVGAEWQHIIYTEYLPIIVGAKGMEMLGEYKGYNASVNPTILNSFATAAYRFGHTQIMPFLPRLDENWREVSRGHLPLFKAFFSPFRIVHEGGIDPLLRGLLATPVKLRTADEAVSSVVTERLFQETHQVALDLAALNIQRGRDHGLPGYNQFRSYCGLTPAESFEDLAGEIPQRDIREKLEQLYGHPDNIDLFVGGVLEKVVEGAILGPTFSCIIVEQFRRLRDGDRFFYKNPGVFTPAQLEQITKASLSKIICTNADNITTVPRMALILQNVSEFVNCDNLEEIDFTTWTECAGEECSCGSRSRRDTLESPLFQESEENKAKRSLQASFESHTHCRYDGRLYQPGSTWVPTKGLMCSCKNGGNVKCML